MKTEKLIIKKQARFRKASHKLTFKELSLIYDHLKDEYGKVALKEANEEALRLEKQYAHSFAEFAKIIKSSDNDYRVSKK